MAKKRGRKKKVNVVRLRLRIILLIWASVALPPWNLDFYWLNFEWVRLIWLSEFVIEQPNADSYLEYVVWDEETGLPYCVDSEAFRCTYVKCVMLNTMCFERGGCFRKGFVKSNICEGKKNGYKQRHWQSRIKRNRAIKIRNSTLEN